MEAHSPDVQGSGISVVTLFQSTRTAEAQATVNEYRYYYYLFY